MIKTYYINSTQALYEDSEFAWLQSLLLKQGIIGDSVGTLGLAVSQSGTPGMSVSVSIGKALVEITKLSKTFKVVIDSDASATVAIPSQSSGANRVGAVIVRVNVTNEPNVLKSNIATLEYIPGTGTSPLSDGAITTAVGSDGWYRLADITVASGASSILNASISDVRSRTMTSDAFTIKDNYSTAVPTGTISPYAGRSAPGNFLLCDGSAVSRATYASLFAVLCAPKVFTVTIASPAVFTSVAHGLLAGDKITFTTTGGLPAGLVVNTTYYVLATGLTADAFRVALSPTGSAINTSGSQNGTHTLYISNFGKGDGSTTFNLPDLRSRSVIGSGASAPTITLDFETSAIGSNQITVPDNNFPYQGQKVQVTTSGVLPTGISASTDYYVIRVDSTHISLATSQANANAGTVMAISAGSGVHTIVATNTARTIVGQAFGEENHGISRNELASHNHSATVHTSGSLTDLGTQFSEYGRNSTPDNTVTIGNAGNDAQHNNMSPALALNYIIRI